jgi:hypothetical protein
MNYPAFFDRLPLIRLRDPLAQFLGVSDDGMLDYRYLDAVRLAGHSCPTVAAAWNMTRLALLALYGDELPERGGIRVAIANAPDEDVTGVIASIVTLLTGAAGEGGFKGIGGQFRRRDLLAYAADIPLELRFSRLDTGCSVDVACDQPASRRSAAARAASALSGRAGRRCGPAAFRQSLAGTGALPAGGLRR